MNVETWSTHPRTHAQRVAPNSMNGGVAPCQRMVVGPIRFLHRDQQCFACRLQQGSNPRTWGVIGSAGWLHTTGDRHTTQHTMSHNRCTYNTSTSCCQRCGSLIRRTTCSSALITRYCAVINASVAIATRRRSAENMSTSAPSLWWPVMSGFTSAKSSTICSLTFT